MNRQLWRSKPSQKASGTEIIQPVTVQADRSLLCKSAQNAKAMRFVRFRVSQIKFPKIARRHAAFGEQF